MQKTNGLRRQNVDMGRLKDKMDGDKVKLLINDKQSKQFNEPARRARNPYHFVTLSSNP